MRFQERWQDYLRSESGQERPIAPVLLLTIATILLTPVLDGWRFGRIVLVALIGSAALMALIRTGANRSVRLAASVAVVSSLVAVAGTSGVDDAVTANWQQITAQAMFALLLLITPVVVLLRLLLRPRITLDTLAGALTAYLQIGLFFAALYRLIDLVDSGGFFVQEVAANAQVFQYFSFITLTTVGYGDYTPATELGQTLAMSEAVFGQVFLVTVVALTVSNLGRELPHRRGLHGDDGSAGDGSGVDVPADDGSRDDTPGGPGGAQS